MSTILGFLGSPVARCAKHAERDFTFACSLSLARQRFPCGRAAFCPVFVPGFAGACIRTVFAPGYPSLGYINNEAGTSNE